MRFSKSLSDEAVDLYTSEIAALKHEVKVLKQRVLAHDKKEAGWLRSVRSATADVDALLEAVSILADSISSARREGRKVRAEARRLLESRGILPPSTLGSSRNRPKSGSKKKSLTESNEDL